MQKWRSKARKDRLVQHVIRDGGSTKTLTPPRCRKKESKGTMLTCRDARDRPTDRAIPSTSRLLSPRAAHLRSGCPTSQCPPCRVATASQPPPNQPGRLTCPPRPQIHTSTPSPAQPRRHEPLSLPTPDHSDQQPEEAVPSPMLTSSPPGS
jgi:hypothetical protein